VPLDGLDHARVAVQITKLMGDGMADPALRDWVLPAFSTTEKTDQAVAAAIMMGTMQKYFTYSWGTRCGIPSVTLRGEAADWARIRDRCAGRLAAGGFGDAPRDWARRHLLPALDGFVESFRDPRGNAARRFWRAVCDRHRPDRSGCVTYSGWLTAFCYWDENGRCLHDGRAGPDGQVRLARNEIPMGFTKVPVTLMDRGAETPTEMVAGSVGIRISKSNKAEAEAEAAAAAAAADGQPKSPPKASRQRQWDGFDTIQPESGWFLYRV
jgi:hypothetical protein